MTYLFWPRIVILSVHMASENENTPVRHFKFLDLALRLRNLVTNFSSEFYQPSQKKIMNIFEV